MVSEAQKRASKKFWLNHKDYYNEKSKQWAKKVRDERKDYKARINKAIELANNTHCNCTGVAEDLVWDMVNILQGEDNG